MVVGGGAAGLVVVGGGWCVVLAWEVEVVVGPMRLNAYITMEKENMTGQICHFFPSIYQDTINIITDMTHIQVITYRLQFIDHKTCS